MATIKYISLNNLELYHQLITNYIDTADAKAIKTVMLSQDRKSLLFYKTAEPLSENAQPAYSILLPDNFNTDNFLTKVYSALNNEIAVWDGNGNIKKSGVDISDLITESEAQTLIDQAVAATTHIKRQIVQDITSVVSPDEMTIYWVKDDTATGADKYKEYAYIGNQMVLIGDTSVDMTDYMTTLQVQSYVASQRTEILNSAAADATTKADQALADAKSYADGLNNTTNNRINALEGRVTTVEGNVTNLQTTVDDHSSRITTIEGRLADMSLATESDIRGLFSSGS